MDIPTDVYNTEVLKTQFFTFPPYPNPAIDKINCKIFWDLRFDINLDYIFVYDILGNIVSELFNGEAQQGYNAIMWNASSVSGLKAASGVYLYRVTARLSDGRSYSDTKRMVLLK